MARLARILALSLGLMALAPSAALANATLFKFNSSAPFRQFYDGDNTANDALTISGSGGTITFSAGVTIDLDATATNCTGGGTQTVTCTDINVVNASGNGGNDVITQNATGLESSELDGNLGEDTLTGSNDPNTQEEIFGEDQNDTLSSRAGSDLVQGNQGNDRVDGGDGDDDLEGDQGADVVTGGAGEDDVSGGEDNGDFVDGGPGDDFVFAFGGDGSGDAQHGGAGFDNIEYFDETGPPTPDNFTINLANGTAGRTNNGPELDSIDGFEDAEGSNGNDTLVGTAGANTLQGVDGNDSLNGGGGVDELFAGPGNDTLASRDGFGDLDSCGDGTDTVTADQLDELSGCEGVQLANVPPVGATTPAAPDTKAPSCKLSKLDTKETRKQFFKGVSFRVRCDERAKLAATAVAHVRRVSHGGFVTSRVGDIVLGTKSAKLGSGTRKLKVKPSKSFRKALGKRFKIRISVVGTDAAGNRRAVTRSVRVR